MKRPRLFFSLLLQ